MRQAARRKRVRAQVSRVSTIPAPTRGWNAKDSIASMRPDDAYELVNFFPTPSDIMLRKGSAAHLTGVSDSVQTLMAYRPESGNEQLWAATDAGKILDASTPGAAPAASVTGLTNGQFQYTNFSTSAGNYLLAVNGADDLQRFDGTNWVSINSGSTPSITNVASSSLIGVNVHKARVWYIEKGSLSMWYAGVGAYSGALAEFPMQSIFKEGGYIMATGTWTLDAGDGVDDYAVFITNLGEVAVYQGTDPSDSSTWALIGVFRIGRPIGRRCLLKFAGDLLVITNDGVVPISKALTTGRIRAGIALSDRIQGAVNSAATSYGDSFGWELQYFPAASMLLMNVPVATGSEEQYVMNTQTGAWAKFQQWPAQCFAVHNGDLYFGMSDEVRQAWTGTEDVSSGISASSVSAFTQHRSVGSKAVRMIRPIIAYDQNPSSLYIDVNVDYTIVEPSNLISLPQQTAAVWDTDDWDVGLWGGSALVRRDWYGATGIGVVLAPHMNIVATSSNFRLSAYDLLIEDGGVL